MTIPGRGDLSPPRRHRRPRRWLAGAVVIAILGGAGYVGYLHFAGSSDTPSRTTAPQPCATPDVGARFAPAGQVRMDLRNASLRPGLARQIARQLRRRGLRVASIGNAARVLHDIATVRYSADQLRQARTVEVQVPGASLQPVGGRRVVELDLGVKFGRLRSATGVSGLQQRTVAGTAPSPSPGCTTP